jgi:hypothetical protein
VTRGAAAGLLIVAVAAGAARAESLAARDTAAVGARGDVQVGVLHPLDIGLGRGLELRAHPLVFLVAPNAILRVAHARVLTWQLTGEYGLSVPTLAMRLLQGYLFPSWDRTPNRIGWLLVPRAGLVASRTIRERDVVTAGADVAVGVPLGRDDTPSLDAPAPLELLFAPVTTGWRARAGGAYDVSLSPRWRLRAAADVYLHDDVTVRASAMADVALGARGRLAFGVTWWNSDQHAIDADGDRIRSNDVLPIVDYIQRF